MLSSELRTNATDLDLSDKKIHGLFLRGEPEIQILGFLLIVFN